MSNTGSLPKWSCSLVAHAYVLKGGSKDITASPVIFVLLPARLLVHVWVRCAIISRLIRDRLEAGHAVVRRVKGWKGVKRRTRRPTWSFGGYLELTKAVKYSSPSLTRLRKGLYSYGIRGESTCVE